MKKKIVKIVIVSRVADINAIQEDLVKSRLKSQKVVLNPFHFYGEQVS